jgi:small-conductance mechanosensitive channel
MRSFGLLLASFACLVLEAPLPAQDTRPKYPTPDERPIPKTAAEAEARLLAHQAFIAAEEQRLKTETDPGAALRLERLKTQTPILNRLLELKRLASEEAAELSRAPKELEETRAKIEEAKSVEAFVEDAIDPGEADAEERFKEARAEVEQLGQKAKAARERHQKDLEAAKAAKATVVAETAAAEKKAAEYAADAAAEEADAKDYVAAGLDAEAVVRKLELAQEYKLLAAEAETQAEVRKRRAEGLLDRRIAVLEAKLALDEATLKAVEARTKEIDRRTDLAIQARLNRARGEASEVARMLDAAPEWARPYWNARKTLVDLRLELSDLARLQKTWEGRVGAFGEVTTLDEEAKSEFDAVTAVDAGTLDVFEVVPQRVEDLKAFIDVRERELDRVDELLKLLRDAKRDVAARLRAARRNGPENIAAAAESARKSIAAPSEVEDAPWFVLEALSDEKWTELVADLKKAAADRLSAAKALDEALVKAAPLLSSAREKREASLVRFRSALRWTRDGGDVSFESLEKAFEDARLLPAYVRERVDSAAGRAVAFARERFSARDYETLGRIGGALSVAILLLIAAAKALPKTAERLESKRGLRAGAAFAVHFFAVLLRRTAFTGLLAFVGVAIPAIAGAPSHDLAAAALLLGAPFVYRTARVSIDVLSGREPESKRPFKWNAVFEDVFHKTTTRLVVVAATFVPAALLATSEGYVARNPGFVELLWHLHAFLSYAVVLFTALRPRRFLSVAGDETGVRARLKAAVLVAYPIVVAALIFLIVLRSLGYAVAASDFLGMFVETAAWIVGAAIASSKAVSVATRGAPKASPPTADPTTEEATWIEEGRAYVKDRATRLFLRLAFLVPAAWFVFELWGLTGAGFDATFGRAILPSGNGKDVVTWANVLFALVYVVGAVYAVRLLRDLLRFVVLPATGADSGIRYAITTLAVYFMIGASGVYLFSGVLKIDATLIGGFVAALGVGLGFGLKEIFENFFSGIILLVERPLKVGDTIVVGGVIGRVDRINMRATTIMTNEFKGLVIPNKELIAQSVVNWATGVPFIRWTAEIGIAYGSDTALFKKVVHEALEGIGLVLKTPKPDVVFDAFGDSSLDFKIHYFARTMTNGFRLKSEVNFALDAALRKAGITIPFPQRDVHFDASFESKIADRVADRGTKPGPSTGPSRDPKDEPSA